MKLVSLVTFVLAVTACSDPDENGPYRSDPPIDVPSCAQDGDDTDCPGGWDAGVEEFGQVAQAITFQHGNNHGLVNGNPNVRCNHVSVNYSTTSPCIFPPRRNLVFAAPTGSNATRRASVQNGLAFMASRANSVGWTIATGAGALIPSTLVCNQLPAGQVVRPTISFAASGANKRAWGSASLVFDVCRAETLKATTGISVDYYLHTAARHGMMSVIGFGEHARNVGCGERLMRTDFLTPGCAQVDISTDEGFGLAQFNVN